MTTREPRILITAPHSGSGKTTVTCALLGALTAAGRRVRSCKCGPDYIDPMFHRTVLGVPSGNLDTFFTDADMTRALLKRKTGEADLTVIEGAMGYYDGLGGTSEIGSAHEVAAITETPVILVVDAKGASVSLAASIQGVLEYRSTLRVKTRKTAAKKPSSPDHNGIRGIILNRVSPGYYPRLKGLIEEKCGVPVLGYFPVLKGLEVPSRHLGLVSPEELQSAEGWVSAISGQARETIDLEAVIRIAETAPGIGGRKDAFAERLPKLAEPVRVAVARDEAFSFYYEENEAVLREMGAELLPFSPLHDTSLPEDIDGLILGGGYPELHVKELQKSPVRKAIRKAVRKGLPCIAECGGFLYLQQSLETAEGQTGRMAGVLPGRGFPTGGLRRFGYCEAETLRGGLFGEAGTKLKGHEFHHWDTDENGNGLQLVKPLSGKAETGVVYTESIAAGFPHFYYAGCPEAAYAFLRKCLCRRAERKAKERWDGIAHPLDGLGKLEGMTAHLSGIFGSPSPCELSKRALVVFCGDHGVVEEGVTQSGYEVTRNVADALAAGRSTVNRMAEEVGADVLTVDIGMRGRRYRTTDVKVGAVIDRRVARGTRNLAKEAAMTEQECREAVEAGIGIAGELAAQGYTLLAAGEMGIGNTTASAALTAALLGRRAEEVVGRGAGLDEEGLIRKQAAVERALQRLRETYGKSLRYQALGTDRELASAALAEVGGLEIAGMAGLFIGGAKCGIPVVADGVISLAAALAAVQIDPRVRDILLTSHRPVEPAGRYLLKALGQQPILRGGFHLGEGSGAVLLFPLLDMAEAVYRETPSFADRGIAAYERHDNRIG